MREATASRYGGTLVIGVSNDVDSFNPLFNETASAQEITHLLLLGLADLNESSEFEPELAESWEFSDDHLSLTYHLRPGLVWSDGQPITAEDVEFTFDLLMNDKVASPRQGETEYIESVIAQDPLTVIFKFKEAYPDQMFDTAGEVLPKHLLKDSDPATFRSHEFGRKPISSGPFVLDKWVPQQYVAVVPNPKYFGDRSYLDKVIFKVVPDNTNLLMQLKTGEVDVMVDLPLIEVEELQKSNPEIAIYPTSGRVYYYLGYNNDHVLFEDRQVRRALTMAIDRQGIINALMNGFGKECLGPFPPMVAWAYNENVEAIPFDPAEAKQTLANLGWRDSDSDGVLDKDGRDFEFTIRTNTGNQLRSDVAIIVQEQLRKIGVKAEIQTLERSTLIQKLRSGDFDATMGGWSTSFNVDPTPLFHSSATDMFNFVKYANPRVDHLIETGREELDRKRPATIWKETQQLIYDDQPYTFLFWKAKIVAARKEFKNVNPIPLSAIYGIEKWYKAAN